MAIRISQRVREELLGQRAELVTNGAFTINTTGWSATTATLDSVAGGQSGNCLSITNSSTANGKAYQDIVTIPNQVYELSLYGKLGTGATIGYSIGTVGTPDSIYSVTNLTPATFTKYTTFFVATATTTRVTLAVTTTVATNTGLFDTITVTKITNSLRDIFAEFYVDIYASPNNFPTQPTTPNTAITDTKLLTLTDTMTADPLTWESLLDANLYLTKTAAVIPASAVIASGTAKYFRLYRKGDDPTTASTTLPRIDGTIGQPDYSPLGDMTLLSTVISTDAVSLSVLKFTIPMECIS